MTTQKKIIIAIVILYLTLAWIRISPAIPWYINALERGDRFIRSGWCYTYEVKFNWSWWSLRFTSIYPDCIER